jgi:Tol biopolymer transport system component
VLESNDAVEIPQSVSPDGHYLLYERRDLDNSHTGLDLWILPLFGDHKPFPVVQTVFDDMRPAVSPDGKWMAYQNNESGRMEVYITAFRAEAQSGRCRAMEAPTPSGAEMARNSISSTQRTT